MNYMLECMNYISRRKNPMLGKFESLNPHSANEGSNSKEQDIIKELILEGKPLMMARFGAIELEAFLNYLQVDNKLKNGEKYKLGSYIKDKCYPKWYSQKTKRGMRNNAGFFPTRDAFLQRWGELVENDLKDLDVIFTWLKHEEFIQSYLEEKITLLNSEMYFPYMFPNPWTSALEGKRVLVVSPFAKLIEQQYKDKREYLFQNKDVLPQFELHTVQAYNILRGKNKHTDVDNWFDALHNMEKEIDKKEFDVALLGCGAYAFNLAAYIKRKGKIAITLCGSHQVLFGIYGNRYEEFLRENNILNEYWVRPESEYKPIGYEKVEDGAYW